MPLPQIFDARLVRARLLTPAVRELVFDRADGAPLAFAPGQWVNLTLPLDGADVTRAYSIASRPDGTPRFELAVTRVEGGAFSTALHALAEGAVVRARGPQGFFTRAAADATPSLFVATGTGITPLRSMVSAALAEGSAAPLWVLFGARHEADVLYGDELAAAAEAHPNVRHVVTLSQPSDSWAGRRGYVQHHLAELYGELRAVAPGSAPRVFACGLERMVAEVRALCRGPLGLDRKSVATERFD